MIFVSVECFIQYASVQWLLYSNVLIFLFNLLWIQLSLIWCFGPVNIYWLWSYKTWLPWSKRQLQILILSSRKDRDCQDNKLSSFMHPFCNLDRLGQWRPSPSCWAVTEAFLFVRLLMCLIKWWAEQCSSMLLFQCKSC